MPFKIAQRDGEPYILYEATAEHTQKLHELRDAIVADNDRRGLTSLDLGSVCINIAATMFKANGLSVEAGIKAFENAFVRTHVGGVPSAGVAQN